MEYKEFGDQVHNDLEARLRQNHLIGPLYRDTLGNIYSTIALLQELISTDKDEEVVLSYAASIGANLMFDLILDVIQYEKGFRPHS